MVSLVKVQELRELYLANKLASKQMADETEDSQEAQKYRGRQWAWAMAVTALDRLIWNTPGSGPVSRFHLRLANEEILAYLDGLVEDLQESTRFVERRLAKLSVASSVLADLVTMLAQED